MTLCGKPQVIATWKPHVFYLLTLNYEGSSEARKASRPSMGVCFRVWYAQGVHCTMHAGSR
jgi:hypothetical protein